MVKRPNDEVGSKAPKRPKTDGPKFYAVRKGAKPGVYNTWKDCQDQITGHAGAQYKSFLDRKQAEDFVAGKNPVDPNSAPKPPRYYAVASGNATGIFTDWKEVEPAITGAKGPKYKRFDDYASAVKFIEVWGDSETIERVKKRPRPSDVANPPGKMKEPRKPSKIESEEDDDLLVISTDGSSRGNGTPDACAGVGVYFGRRDPRNVSERLEGLPQTNQRAELTAILRALEIAPLTQNVKISTDSQYSINCTSVWYKTWEEKKWKTINGEPVKNMDLVQAIRKRIEARDKAGGTTGLVHVKGHGNDPGNIAADRLAVAGALGAKIDI